MKPDPVRVRFAPSPTGPFHVGGARTALFNYLFARHEKGQFILRIEDTDRNRFDPESLDFIMDGLKYLGLDWDEGPDIGGPYGPYTQSQRFELYCNAADNLLNSEHAYRCFCTPERLEKVRREREKARLSHGYDRHCRNLGPDEIAKKMKSGDPFTVRIKIPLDGQTMLNDLILGEISFNNSELQDSILLKVDGTPTYHLANVVDDHAMKISHVLRGSEWVNSIPLHMNLYAAFGWKSPEMAHLPLILNPSGKGKLSKRNKISVDGKDLPVFVQAFRDSGYLSEALVNYLALLGWSFDDKTEIMTRSELIERFSIDRINSSPAAWNYEKLDHINGQYIRSLSVSDLHKLLVEYLNSKGKEFDQEQLLRIVPLIQERIETLGQTWEKIDFFFMDELNDYDATELISKNSDKYKTEGILQKALKVLNNVDYTLNSVDEELRSAATELNVKAGQMFQPVRVAVCGKKVAPPLIETLIILGREVVTSRLEKALNKLITFEDIR